MTTAAEIHFTILDNMEKKTAIFLKKNKGILIWDRKDQIGRKTFKNACFCCFAAFAIEQNPNSKIRILGQ